MNQKLLELITSYTGTVPEEITPESDIIADLGISSIDMVSLIMDFEDTFHLTVSDEQLAKLRTVGDVQALIKG